jgi:GNAT superfamily N-acetyltransferase
MRQRQDWSTAAWRTAEPEDAGNVAALLRDAYRSWTRLGLNPKAAMYGAADVVKDLHAKEVWLLERNGLLLATVTLLTWDIAAGFYLKVTHLATPSVLQKCGLGSEVMRRAENLALERRIPEVRLDTAVVMKDLIAFYEKRGYVAFGELDHWEGTNYDSQHFHKGLRQ